DEPRESRLELMLPFLAEAEALVPGDGAGGVVHAEDRHDLLVHELEDNERCLGDPLVAPVTAPCVLEQPRGRAPTQLARAPARSSSRTGSRSWGGGSPFCVIGTTERTVS